MVSAITKGVKITVATHYQEDYSQPLRNEYLFAYRITIENQSELTVKLLRRHWYIFDSMGEYKEVEGEGVVGRQPVLEPGESYSYTSGCNLQSAIGQMHGTYLMQDAQSERLFPVTIPEFQLIAPLKLN